ncbi:hypothetical protein F4802DRAFT_570340, partial [Xylaria palmicola]
MWPLLWPGLFVLFVEQAFTSPTNIRLDRDGLATVPLACLVLRQTGEQGEADDVFDSTDLSFIQKLAAIGDSYSAGIGAGDRLGSVLYRRPCLVKQCRKSKPVHNQI